DTPGHNRFKQVTEACSRHSHGALAVFDLRYPDSFDEVFLRIEDFRRATLADIPVILVGNKSDLANQRKVSREQATALAKRLNILYIETSGRDASNVEEALVTVVTAIYHKMHK
ncbi:unnamed protein product, partial [Rotaria sp. Silwood2]